MKTAKEAYTKVVSPIFISFENKYYSYQLFCYKCGEPIYGEDNNGEIEVECNCSLITGKKARELRLLFLSDII